MFRVINYFYAIFKAKKNEHLSSDRLKQLQFKKFIKLIKYVRKHVPYYTNVLNGIEINSLEDIRHIPFLTKQIVLDEHDSLKANNISKRRFVADSTSGSTGESTYFYTDKKLNWIRHACAYRGDSWTGWKFGEPEVILWGAERDIKKHNMLSTLFRNIFYKTTILSSFYMTDTDMDNYIQIINNKKPSLIVGYPSSLEVFSNYIKLKNVQIHSPKGIITGGESLYEDQRNLIQKTFHCRVLNRYGGREVGHIANECQNQDGLHIDDDHVIVEVVDSDGKNCAPGELGQIVVTDLDNYVFPFIRYKIGDLGVISDQKCKCGMNFSVLSSVIGRTFDVVVGTNGNKLLASFFTIFLRHSVQGIKRFQLVQNSNYDIILTLEVTNDFNEDQVNIILNAFKQKLGEDINVRINISDNIPLTSSGKFRWVISNVTTFN